MASTENNRRGHIKIPPDLNKLKTVMLIGTPYIGCNKNQYEKLNPNSLNKRDKYKSTSV